MRLHSITLNNFKQYYGNQFIQFAGDKGTEQENVTVIFGENGRGKTSLYRALLFGLYGDIRLEQDEQEDSKESIIYLSNLKAIDEAFLTDNKRVIASVKIIFSHLDEQYEIERSLFATKLENQIIEDRPTVKLVHFPKGEGTVIYSSEDGQEQKIIEIMDSVLDRRVKTYFLFDGERIESLTKATKRQRVDIQKGIKNLLHIDNLFLLQDALKQNQKQVMEQMGPLSSGEFKRNIAEIAKVDFDIKKLQDQKIEVEKEIELAELEKEQADQKIKQFADDKIFWENYFTLEERIKNIESKRNEFSTNLVNNSSDMSILLVQELIEEQLLELKQKVKSGDIPSQIRAELIDRLLHEMTCICGTQFDLDSNIRKTLEDWKKRSSTQELETMVINFYGDLESANRDIHHNTNSLKEQLQQIRTIEDQLEEHIYEMDLLKKNNGQTNGVSKEKYEQDMSYRDDLITRITKKQNQLEIIESQIVELEDRKAELHNEQKKLEAGNEQLRQLQQSADLIQRSLEALKEIIENFEHDIREELQQRASRIYSQLIDKAGSINVKDIIVKDNYTLEVLDWAGRPFLANISAGQRQIVSLAFITALAEVAGGTSALEMPLFMDTPFGRLSKDHRINLLQKIPYIAPQWILLVTSSEFRQEIEGKHLMDTNKWGRYYILESESEGVTKINPIALDELI